MGRRLSKEISSAASVVILMLLVSCATGAGGGEGPTEMYKSAYESLVEAEMAQMGNERELALSKWNEALERLKELQKAHPDWNRLMIGSKIQECEGARNQLSGEEKTASPENIPPVTVTEASEETAPARKPPSEIEKHLAKGNDLAREKRYDEAIGDYEKALGVDPNSAVAYFNIATCYEQQEKDDDAVRMLKKALQAEPGYDRVHYKLGEIYLSKDMIDMSVSEYKKVLSEKPDDPVAHWEIAGMYFKIKKLDDAIKHYDRAAELFGETTPDGLEAIRNSEKIKLLKQEMGLK